MDDLFAHLGFRFDKFYNDKAVKEDYFKYLLNRAARQRQFSKEAICITHWDRNTIQKTMLDIVSNKTSEYRSKYDVREENGANVLVLRRPLRAKPLIYRKIMALEDSYEILSRAHRETGHKGYRSIFSVLRVEWSFPVEFFHALYAVCNVCKVINQIAIEKAEPKTDDPNESSSFKCSTWRLKFINLQIEIPYIEHPKYIIVFEDEHSQFLIMRALRDNSSEEVTKQLINVFFGFGPPQIITADDPQIKEIIDPALSNIAKLYPRFETTINYTGETTVITDKTIINTLKNWIEDAEVLEYEIDCEVGCYVVQRRLNSRLRLIPANADSMKIKTDKHKAFIPHVRFYNDELSYEDIDLEVMVLGDLNLRDLFCPVSAIPATLLQEFPIKRSLPGGKPSSSKSLKTK